MFLVFFDYHGPTSTAVIGLDKVVYIVMAELILQIYIYIAYVSCNNYM